MNYYDYFNYSSLIMILKSFFYSTITIIIIRYFFTLLKQQNEQEQIKKQIINNNNNNNKQEERTFYLLPKCLLCNKDIYNSNGILIDSFECLELNCYHIFHKKCFINYHLFQCPLCKVIQSKSILSSESKNVWKTVNYWNYYINQALNQLGPNPSGLSWSNVRIRAKELANLSIDILKEGEMKLYDGNLYYDDEDLGGPGFFPLKQALYDGECIHYEVDGIHYKTCGKWITNKSSEGTEREIWKLSWGSPPWATCNYCNKLIQTSTGITCNLCFNINPEVVYWCNKSCQLLDQTKHKDNCQLYCNLWNQYTKSKD